MREPLPPLTPEQIQRLELGIKLESIFMPEARRHRDKRIAKIRKGDEPLTNVEMGFVHYTTAEAALNIIQTKRIWMRNTTCMADYREVEHGFNLLRKFFSDENKRKSFIDALDLSVPGAAKEAISSFDAWWNTIRYNTFITSISEHDDEENEHGRLSMWRAFGGQTGRVALVFKFPFYTGAADALQLMFSPVAYLKESQVEEVFHEVVANIRREQAFLATVPRANIVGTVFRTLLAGVTCLKHEGFKEEREWRAIYSPKIFKSSLIDEVTKVVNGVPQQIHEIPLDESKSPELAGLELARIFDQLIIGPSQFPIVMAQAFVDALTRAGVPDAAQRVRASLIPIRSW